MAIKVGLGKLELHAPYDDFMHRGIVGNDFEILPVEPGTPACLRLCRFIIVILSDRLLVAQVLIEAVPIISGDTQLDAYGVKRLWVKMRGGAPATSSTGALVRGIGMRCGDFCYCGA